jgi:hypothetical protein
MSDETSPKLTSELLLRYQDQPAEVLRELAEQAQTDEVRDALLERAKKAENSRKFGEAQASKAEEPKDEAKEHDEALLAIANKLNKPSTGVAFKTFWYALAQKAWGLKLTQFIAKAARLGGFFLAACIVTSSLCLFLTHSIKFGLGFQGFVGTVILGIINIFFYAQMYDPTSSKKERFILGVVVSIICFVIVGVFNFRISLTPNQLQNNYTWSAENVGIIIDRNTHQVVQIAYPDGSPLVQSDEAKAWMSAPNIFKHDLEWFSLIDKEVKLVARNGNTTMTFETVINHKLKVKAGDTVHVPLPSEKAYRTELDTKITQIFNECINGVSFDHAKCKALLNERLSNEIFSVEAHAPGIKFTKTVVEVIEK